MVQLVLRAKVVEITETKGVRNSKESALCAVSKGTERFNAITARAKLVEDKAEPD